MVFILIFSLAGCGGNAVPEPTGAGTSASPAETTEASATAESDASPEAVAQEPVTFDLYVDHSWFWFDKWGGDPVSQKITGVTGVNFNVTRATDDQQLALLISSGDLPDLVYTGNTAVGTLLSTGDVSYSYNELVEKTGVDIHATEREIINNTAADGNYYALLNAYTSQEAIDKGDTLLSPGIRSIAYRNDIYEEIGSPEINTLEDLESALLASKEKYPNVIPLLNDKSYLWYFAEQLGVAGDGSVGYDKDGNPRYVLNVDGVQDYFALLNRYARQGLINAEAQTYNFDKFSEVRNSGGSFMQLRSSQEASDSTVAAKQSGSGYTWSLLTKDLSDSALVGVNTGIGWSGTYITKKCEDPERAITFMSWARSEEGRRLCSWGIQGEHWDFDGNGKTVTTEQYRAAVSDGKRKQDDFGIAVWIFGDQGDENAFIDHAVTDPNLIDSITRLKSAVAHTKVWSELYFAKPKSGEELIIFNSLQDMFSSEILKVIFAETDEEYQAALSGMYKQADQIGIAKLEAWMRTSVAEHK